MYCVDMTWSLSASSSRKACVSGVGLPRRGDVTSFSVVNLGCTVTCSGFVGVCETHREKDRERERDRQTETERERVTNFMRQTPNMQCSKGTMMHKHTHTHTCFHTHIHKGISTPLT